MSERNSLNITVHGLTLPAGEMVDAIEDRAGREAFHEFVLEDEQARNEEEFEYTYNQYSSVKEHIIYAAWQAQEKLNDTTDVHNCTTIVHEYLNDICENFVLGPRDPQSFMDGLNEWLGFFR